MKVAPDKITVLLGCYATHAMYTNTAWVANHFTHHVLSHLVFVAETLLRDGIGLTTDWPLRDVIRPFIWCNRCWRLTKSEAVYFLCHIFLLSRYMHHTEQSVLVLNTVFYYCLHITVTVTLCR